MGMTSSVEHQGGGLWTIGQCTTTGLLVAGDRALLVDPASPEGLAACLAAGYTGVDWALATHYHRDSCAGLEACHAAGARLAVPAAEVALFDDVERHWAADQTQFHRYRFRPGPNALARSAPVDLVLVDGDDLAWGGYTVRAVATPGHTDGSMSYVVQDGAACVAFVGDLLYGEGQLWELWSLQGPPPGAPVGVQDYHAFCGRARQALASLERLLQDHAPDLLVPAHGPVIRNPAQALETLRGRVEALLTNYYSVSSMRYYFPDWTAGQAGQRPTGLPGALVAPPPWFLVGVETTRALVGPSGRCLVIDCGSAAAAEGVARWLTEGTITGVDAVWISHYHDDHVGGIANLVRHTGCAVWAGHAIAEILAHPEAYAMPCLDPTPAPPDRLFAHGESITWESFALTVYDFPGQTLLHSALLARRDGVSLLVGGDSFTPGGLDDYCAHNRNLLGAGQGYQRCLDLLEEVQPDMLVNMHVEQPFTLPPDFLAELRAALQARERLVGALAPWPHPNFALDPYWARCWPYRQRLRPGASGALALRLTNHGVVPLAVWAALDLPPGWPPAPTAQAAIAPGAEGALAYGFTVPPDQPTGRVVLTVSLHVGDRDLPAWTEALVDVEP